MKKSILFLFLLCCTSILMAKQQSPRPDWTFEKPTPSNKTFYYHIEHATGATEPQARNLALAQAFMQAAMRVGIAVDIEEITSAIASGKNFNVISERYEIPISIVCTHLEELDNGEKRYWILCQIAQRGNILPAYDDYSDCYKTEKYAAEQLELEQQQQSALKKANGKAIAASVFIPGLGQMLKGKGGAGAGILISEVALVGGGTVCYFLGQKQSDIMKGRDTSYEAYTNAKNTKNTMDIAMYSCYGAAAAIYIFNLCHAYLCKPTEKGLQRLSYYPVIIPANELTTPNYAYGIGIQYKF